MTPQFQRLLFFAAIATVICVCPSAAADTKTIPQRKAGDLATGQSDFIPHPGTFRMMMTLSDSKRGKVRNIVETSRWLKLQQEIFSLADENQLPPPRRPVGPSGQSRSGRPGFEPPGAPGQEHNKQLGTDLLAAMAGTEAPSDSNSFSPKQKRALQKIESMQSELKAEWLKVWASVRPLLNEENMRELKAINNATNNRRPIQR